MSVFDHLPVVLAIRKKKMLNLDEVTCHLSSEAFFSPPFKVAFYDCCQVNGCERGVFWEGFSHLLPSPGEIVLLEEEGDYFRVDEREFQFTDEPMVVCSGYFVRQFSPDELTED